MSPLQPWPGLQLLSPTPRPAVAPQQPSPPAPPLEGDGPLNLTKPKGHSSGHKGSGFNKHGGGGTGSPVGSFHHPTPEVAGRNMVPPGLVLPPNFMPFATFPLPQGKITSTQWHLSYTLFFIQLGLLYRWRWEGSTGLISIFSITPTHFGHLWKRRSFSWEFPLQCEWEWARRGNDRERGLRANQGRRRLHCGLSSK